MVLANSKSELLDLCLGLRGFELRARRIELRIEVRGVDEGHDLVLGDRITDIDQPLGHVARDARIDERTVPAARLARKHQRLNRWRGLRPHNLDRRQLLDAHRSLIAQGGFIAVPRPLHHEERDDQYSGHNGNE